MSTVEHRSISDTFKAYYMRHPWLYSALAVAVVGLVLWASSLDSSRPKPPRTIDHEDGRIFTFVRTTLDEAEESRVDHVAASLVERLNQWMVKLNDRTAWRTDPFMNAFIENNLPQPQQRVPAGLVDFEKLEFDPSDGYFVQECMWLSQVVETIREQEPADLPEDVDPRLAQINQLFDWTVRNIALEAEEDSVPHFAWQVILHGTGRVIDRAWVFSLLCRQAGYDVVMLGRVSANPAANAQGPATQLMTPWIPAVVLDGKLYLFEHEYGVPLSNADGSFATLSDVVADESPLRALDIPGRPYPMGSGDLNSLVAMIEASPNFLTRRMFILENHLSGKLNFGQSAQTGSLSESANVIGSDPIRLSFKPAILAEQLSTHPHVQSVAPWGLPYERRFEQMRDFRILPDDASDEQRRKRKIITRVSTEMLPFYLRGEHTFQSDEDMINVIMQEVLNPDPALANETEQERQTRMAALRTKTEEFWNVLLRGRLRYLEGIHGGDRSASWYYQKARPSASEMAKIEQDAKARTQQLVQIIQNSAESDQNRAAAAQERGYLEQLIPNKRISCELATYWLGLLHFQKQSYQEAVVYFGERFCDNPDYADSRFLAMARYNLGRSLEELSNEKARQAHSAEADDPIHGEVEALREQALGFYEGETDPLYVPQARARATLFRRQLQAVESD